jgi:hypothetical protein
MTTNGVRPGPEEVQEDLVLCQERWRKAVASGRYFRAERWLKMRDLVLDHL